MTTPLIKNKIKVISGPKSWIEGDALAQLEKVASLRAVERVWGMPGVHPGPGHPIDAVFAVRDRVYPHLVGADIGCGIGWWRLKTYPKKPERWAKKIVGMERGVTRPTRWLGPHRIQPCGFEHSLGTVGHGNHFAEIVMPDKVLDMQAYARFTDSAPALLLVHSGSRGYGEKILHEHTEKYQDRGLVGDSAEAVEYLTRHDHAMAWARANRTAIADRMLEMIGIGGDFLKDIPHNFVEPEITDVTPEVSTLWWHRKGAIPINQGAVIIPGSRGAYSYLVEPIVKNCHRSGYSLSHGAGRKMSRRDARQKFNAERDSIQRLQRTKFNSIVICEDRELLMEEAPEAYKSIDRVIQDLVDHELCRVVAMLKPVITYKYRRPNDEHDEC